ncbi:hypothetical protein ACLOJK_026318 [Asimina triloba]
MATGTKITVPLSCACPTKKHSRQGVKYLLSYLIAEGNNVMRIQRKIISNTETPTSSQTITPPPPPSSPPQTPPTADGS